MTLEEFTALFLNYVKTACSVGDCYPQPGLIERDDGALAVLAMAVPPEQLVRVLVATANDTQVRRIAFGLDRFTKPGQGTTMGSVFTYTVAERGGEPSYGFVEYDGDGGQRQHDLTPEDYWYEYQAASSKRVLAAFSAER